MAKIKVSSPTRVDLAGGTLDCWPLYLFFGGACTVNLPISVMTHAELDELPGSQVRVTSHDIDLDIKAESVEAFLSLHDEKLQFYQILLKYFKPQNGFHLTTRSESPVGGGLGGSSSLLMSCLKLFSQWLHVQMAPNEMVRLAGNMEAEMLKKPTGTQDYYPAVFSKGINLIDYGVADPQVTAVEVPAHLFENRFLLVYTGRSHHSGINNWDVIKKVIDGDQATLSALGEIRQIANELREKCLKQDFTGWPQLFERETKARLALTDSFSSPEIEALKEIALKEGAEAVKICGAGGGGCVFLWTPQSAFSRVKQACQSAGFTVLDAKPIV